MTNRPNHGFLLMLILSLALPPAVLAQGDKGDGEPCCGITAFDRRTGTVTALEAGTGRTFQFIATPAQRLTVKVGQKLWADFDTQKVSVNRGQPCCAMVNLTLEAIPCCGISVIDASTGVVTAIQTATGRVFKFKVADPALLGGLAPGQKVWADFGAGRVRTNLGIAPCCDIVAALKQP